jgi:hypothetical protein
MFTSVMKETRDKAAGAVAEGSGVELTLARIIAEQHKGWIARSQSCSDRIKAEWTFTFRSHV